MTQTKRFVHRHRTGVFFMIVAAFVLLASILAYGMIRKDPPSEPWREDAFQSIRYNIYYCRVTPGLFEKYALPDAEYPQDDKNPEHYIGVACTVSYDQGTLAPGCHLSISNDSFGDDFYELIGPGGDWFQAEDLFYDLLLNITDRYSSSVTMICYIGDATDEEIEESLKGATCRVSIGKQQSNDYRIIYTYPLSPPITSITRLTPLVDY